MIKPPANQQYLLPTLVRLGLALLMAVVLSLQLALIAYAAGFTVNTTNDTVDVTPGDGNCIDVGGKCSLRAAIMEANALGGTNVIAVPADTYTLTQTVEGEDFAVTGDLDIRSNLTINGAGASKTIIQAGATTATGIDRVFHLPVGGITVNINDVTIQNGRVTAAGDGGGIHNQGNGTLTINNSTIANNRVEGNGEDGGGVANTGGIVNILNSTISGNAAPSTSNFAAGGGIFNTGGGTTNITNTTISTNTAEDNGGGIHNQGGTVTIINSTLFDNSANLNSIFAGGNIRNTATMFITNSIVANGHAPNFPAASNCTNEAITSGGYNIEDTNQCGFASTGDLPNTNPLLGPLQNNGGETDTHALSSGSPAINHIPNATNGCGTTIATDQRGITRPQGSSCDVGAYEAHLDLSITKSVTPTTGAPGDTITYTLYFSNTSVVTATGVIITDSIPVSVTHSSLISSSSGATITATGSISYVWDVEDLSPSESGIITISGILSDPLVAGMFTNTAEITSSSVESDTTNNSDLAAVTVVMPDLSIVKSVNPSTAQPGDTITYTLTFSNAGDGTATGVIITDSIPVSITHSSLISSSSGATITPTGSISYVWNVADLSPNEWGIITISGVLSGNLSAGTFTNTATITTTTVDGDTNNNIAAVGLTVVVPEMAVIGNGTVISDGDTTPETADDTDFGTTPVAGGTVVRTFTISNSGTGDLNLTGTPNVTLTTSAHFTISTQPVSSTIGSGSTTTFQITFDPSAVGSYQDTVNISNDDANENPYTFVISGTGTAPDLSISKAVTPTLAVPGQPITYTLTFSNAGSGLATGIVITDNIPITVTNVTSTSSGATITPTGGFTFAWTVEDLAAGEGGIITISGQINTDLTNSITLTNTALITSAAVDTDTLNNTATVTTTVLAHILLVASAGTDNVLRYDGTTGAFIDIFASGGLDSPQDLTFGPDGNLYVSSYGNDSILRYNGITGALIDTFVSTGSGGLDGPTFLTFGLDGNLYVSSFLDDRILRYDGATGAFIDTFVTSGSGGLDMPFDLVFGPNGNLYVSSYNNDRVLRYNGTTGTLIDTFVPAGSGGLDQPYGLLFGSDGNLYVSSAVDDRVLRYDGTTGAFIDIFVPTGGGPDRSFGMAFGPDGNLYVAKFDGDRVLRYNGATGAFIDIFVPTGSGGLDRPVSLVFYPDADLAVNKMVNNSTPNEGETITYTVTVSNTGPSDTSGVIISDTLPGGLTFGGYVASQGVYTGSTGAWVVGSLAANVAATLTITATVDGGTGGQTLTNTTVITVSNQYDSDFANNTASVTVAVTTTLIVNSANDVDDGSCNPTHCNLREAIDASNANNSVTNTIIFNIPGAGPHTITPTGALPVITDPVIIDALTEPGVTSCATAWPPTLQIELDGSSAGNVSGLNITAGSSTIRGLVINRFQWHGIQLTTNGGNRIECNFIGTDIAGTSVLSNGIDGVNIDNVANNTIGGNTSGTRNLISGNNDDNIEITGSSATSNTVANNYIGVNRGGTAALTGRNHGVQISAGAAANIIGTNGDGTNDATEGNLISGNGGEGILITGSGSDNNRIAGNFIGTNAAGTASVGNARSGVQISSNPTANIVGTNGDGVADSAERNLISGNGAHGVRTSDASGNIVAGNYIGTDINGTASVQNGGEGIRIERSGSNRIGTDSNGTADSAERNLISGNNSNGIRIFDTNANNNLVAGNYIGPNAAGTGNLGNGLNGVLIEIGATGNTIGGSQAASNTIAFNGGDGVAITGTSTTTNTIQANSIFSNTGLGIDLNDDGVTANDSGDGDSGPNNRQNFPVLSSVIVNGANIDIAGAFNSTAVTSFTLEFFANTLCDASGNGEGELFLITDTVTTNGSGNATFSVSTTNPAGKPFISATATDSSGNTSEFAACLQVGSAADLSITKAVTPTTAIPGQTITYTLTFSNAGNVTAGGVVITDSIPVSVTNSSLISSSSGATITAMGSISYVWTVADLSAGEWGIITISGVLSGNLSAGTFTNTATITTTSVDSDTTNNSDSAGVTVVVPDLSIVKSVTPTTAAPGDTITYTISITNNDTFPILGLTVTDTLSTDTNYVTNTLSSGSFSGGNPVSLIGSQMTLTNAAQIPALGVLTFTFQVTANTPLSANLSLVNTVGVTVSSGAIITPTDTATVSVSVANIAPIAVNDVYTISEDGGLATTVINGVLANDSDVNGDILTATVIISPSHGTLSTFNANGSFTYTPAINFAGTDVFTYLVSDGNLTDTARVTIIVTPTNDPPAVGTNRVLYDGALGTVPLAQGQFIFTTTGPTESFSGNFTSLDTTISNLHQGGWAHTLPFHLTPTLDRNAGYTIKFTVKITSEDHTSSGTADKDGDGIADRAGFSIIALSSDRQGIELGFWTDRIWAQEDGLVQPPGGTLFTHAEDGLFNTTTGLITYELTISGSAYSLAVGSAEIVSGSLRDYSAFGLPYSLTNYIFLGDDTTSANANFALSYVSVITNVASPDRSTVANTPLVINDVGLFDIDAGGNSVTVTLTVGNGALQVDSSVPGGLTAGNISNNGSSSVTLSGPIGQINTTLTFSPALTYTPNTGFYGTDMLTATINDNGYTGTGGALSNTKRFNINVLAADVRISKSVTPTTTIVPGNTISYTLTFSNAGNTLATGVVITDSITVSLTHSSLSFTYTGAIITSTGSISYVWNVEDLSPGESGIITISGILSSNLSAGTITNTARITTTLVDSDTTNNVATNTLAVTQPQTNLEIVKTSSPDPVIAGRQLTYTVSITNNGPSDAGNLAITDTLPGGVIFNWSNACAHAGGVVTCTRSSLIAGDSAVYTIVVTVSASISGSLSNVVTVTNSITDLDASNNTFTTTTTVNTEADLVISKFDSADPITAGLTLTYTLYITNNGPSEAQSVIITDTLPGGIAFVSATGSSSCSGSGPVVCNTSSLTAGSSLSYTIVVTVDAGTTGILTNVVTATSQNTTDPDVSNNSFTATTTVNAEADVSIDKDDGVSGAIPGQTVTYTIVVSNSGPSDAPNAIVTDTFPVEIVSTSWSCTQAGGATGCASGTGDINDTVNLPVGGIITYTVVATINSNATGTLVNTASVVAGVTDPNSSNNDNSDSDTLNPQSDLVISKTDSSDPVVAGERLTYTITITNNGPSDAANVTITDTLPGGVTFASAGGCSNVGSAVTCTITSLAMGASVSRTIVVTVDASTTGSVVNTAGVTVSTAINTGDDIVTETTAITTQTDLEVGKIDVIDPVVAGETLTYTITITNNGPSDALGVVVTDTLPGGVSLASTSGCAESPAAGLSPCTLGTITAGASAQYTVVVTVSALTLGTIVNTATVDSSTPLINTGNDTATETTTINTEADLEVAKSDTPDAVIAGTALTYTLSITNHGPSNARTLTITDTLPSGVTFALATGSCTHAGGVVTCTVSNLNVGFGIQRTIVVTVNAATLGTIVNTATVAAVTIDLVSSNNTITEPTTVNAEADLIIGKTDNPDPVVAGQALTYTITITNNGPSDALGVVVTDTLSGGVTFASTNGCAEDPNGVSTCSLGTIAAGTNAQYMVVVTVGTSITGSVVNTATVSAGTTLVNSGDDLVTETTTITTQADLIITKNDTPDPVLAGNPLTYTVTITNNGPSDVHGVVVTDTLSSGVTLASTSGCVEDPGGVPTCTLGTIAVGASKQYTIVVTVNPSTTGSIVNTATVVSTGTPLINTSDDTITETTTINVEADLEISKTDSADPVVAGRQLTYTLTITNNGPSDMVIPLTISDTLDTGATFAGATPGCTHVAGTVTCVVSSLAANATVSRTIVVTVNSSTTSNITNTATVSNNAVVDADLSNNIVTETTTVNTEADLGISKADSPDPVVAGQMLTYTVIVTNNGPSDALNVVVTDTLPAGVTFLWTPGGSCAEGMSGVPTCTLNSIVAGATKQYTIAVTVYPTTTGSIVNTATVSSTTTDPGPTSNTITETTAINVETDLAITKTVSISRANPNQLITYTITFNNNGVSPAAGVIITDIVPLTLTNVTSGSSGVLLTPLGGATYAWSITNLPAGAGGIITISGRISSALSSSVTFANTAQITTTDTDTNGGNDSSSVSVTVPEAQVVIDKWVNNAVPGPGDTITYTIVVTNNGPDAATGIVVSDTLPVSVTYVVSNAGSGTYNAGTGLWSGLGSLGAGQSHTLTVTVTVNAGTISQTIVNTAVISAVNEIDALTGNTASVTITVKGADLEVVKTVDNNTPSENGAIVYTIVVTNNGPDDTTGVVISDTLPLSVTQVASSATQGIYDAFGGWAVGNLNNNGSATLIITATIGANTAGQTITNVAAVNAQNLSDQITANNIATATLVVRNAELEIGKSVTLTNPKEGDVITYTIVITNNGPDSTAAITVSDNLPVGLSNVGSTATAGSYSAGTNLWVINSTLNNGAVATLTITATVNAGLAGVTIINTADITASAEGDSNTLNNSAGASLLVQESELVVDKVVAGSGQGPAKVIQVDTNTLINYTLVVTNNGPDPLPAGTVITDTVPMSLTFLFVGVPVGNGSAPSANPVVWTLPQVISGQAVSMTISALVTTSTAGNTILNTAVISSATQGDTNTANNSSVATITVRGADLELGKSVTPILPLEGDTITYTIVLTNNGPDAADNLFISDTLPSPGVTFGGVAAGSPSQGIYTASVPGVWDVGTLGNGLTATLIFTATVDGGTASQTLINTAAISSSTTEDLDTSNNVATASITVAIFDLAITKSSVRDNMQGTNGVITYTLTVVNNSGTTAPGAIIVDAIPGNVVSFTTWTCTGTGLSCPNASGSGAINETTGIFPVGGQLVYTITATLVSSNTTVTNTATVTSLNGLGDLYSNNNIYTDVSRPAGDIYLPIIFKNFVPGAVSLPDLVIDSIVASSSAVTVVIRNAGLGTVNDAFWVDVYYNQTPVYNVSGSAYWGLSVGNGGVPIAPQGIVTLTLGGSYHFFGVAPSPGTAVQGLVDSIGPDSYIAVEEVSEANNTFGPVNSTAILGAKLSGVSQNTNFDATGLPPR